MPGGGERIGGVREREDRGGMGENGPRVWRPCVCLGLQVDKRASLSNFVVQLGPICLDQCRSGLTGIIATKRCMGGVTYKRKMRAPVGGGGGRLGGGGEFDKGYAYVSPARLSFMG